MNLQEAYKVLDVSPTISNEDLKAKWKESAKKYHPDFYKEDVNKFKLINEAYQFIKDYRENPPPAQNPFNRGPFVDFGDIFSNFGFGGASTRQSRTQRRNVQNIILEQELSFKESILGVSKEIEVEREVKCDNCNGEGFARKSNNCQHCDGFGQSTRQQGNITFSTSCGYCRGQNSKEDCNKCERKGFVKTKTKMNVSIPAGVIDGNIIQLQGAGNFAHTSVFGDNYSSILINIKIVNDTPLSFDGENVIFNLNISLLEALEGCKKTIPTIHSDLELTINPDSKNKDEVIIPNAGISGVGNQKVILNVNYPEDKEKLINILKEIKDKNVSN